jgi:hypothetical protein
MGNGANHAKLLIVFYFTHQSEINDAELSIVCSNHVSWMGIGMEPSGLEKLHQVAGSANVDQTIDLAWFSVDESSPVDPLHCKDLSTSVFEHWFRSSHLLQRGHHSHEPKPVLCLLYIVHLVIESVGPLI